MILLERVKALHDHIDECDYCTTRARENVLCHVGRALLYCSVGDALLAEYRFEDRDREVCREAAEQAAAAEAAKHPRKTPPAPSLARARKILETSLSEAPATEVTPTQPEETTQ